ncbi:MAG: ABC transporter ATP-binding protein [Chloroflexi bacterium]|nr:MAG: ABC transporter ATP-binding protein [Chloroflexota bacterium]
MPAPGPRRPAIRSTGLTKHYGARAAVDGIDLEIPDGVIAGFVGPNGSGKTTTIRMLLALVSPSAGEAEVLGTSIRNPGDYLPRVGALIEGPAFYPTLSGRRNLEVLTTLGGIPRSRVEEVLDLVELRERAGDHVRTYSMGMKQRLGIAAAMLPNPEVLILDEPANGLDPAGILEMRRLLSRLRDQGITIFISSHLLSEVEQVADWILVLKDGRLLFQGPTADLLSRRHGRLLVAAEHEAGLTTVATIAEVAGFKVARVNGHLEVDAPASFAAQLNRQAMAAGVTLVEISRSHASLEETFLDLTNGETR